MVASAVIGGVAALGGAAIASSGAKSAGKAQAEAARQAGNAELEMFYQNREDMLPWLETGQKGLSRLSDLLGTSENTTAEGYGSLAKNFSSSDFVKEPGYEFRLAEGEKALNRSMAAKGGTLSGAAAKALQRFNQDYASNEFNNAYNRYTQNQTNLYNRLAGVSGTGQTAASQIGNLGQNAAQAYGNAITGSANASAAGTIGSANAWNTGLNNAAGSLSNYAMLNYLKG